MADFSHHEPCPNCGSSDNLARYSDGSASCFGFECGHYEPPNGEEHKAKAVDKGGKQARFLRGETRRLESRRISQDTTEKFGYKKAKHPKLGVVFVAPYYDAQGNLVAQKIRTKDKDFRWIGDPKLALPFGAQLWNDDRKVVVTEGEIDAMAMSQVQGNMYPTVSIASGAGGQVERYMAEHRDYFRSFEEVILMFDMDEAGQKAAQLAAKVVGYDKTKIAKLSENDPSDMLRKGKSKELKKAMWNAERYSPAGIVDLATMKDKIMERPTEGFSWCFATLTELTYGKRYGELYAIGAGTGTGKTDFITQDIQHVIRHHQHKVGVFALEQNPAETGTRLMGKFAKTPLHIPDHWDPELFDETWEQWVTDDQVFFYDSFGVNRWGKVKDMIKFLYHAHGVRDFYLDHLTALAAAIETEERKALDNIMGELGSLVKELDILVTFVSHLATPDGTPHEEGGRVKIRHFRGSRAIGFWSHYMFGLERDQQAEDPTTRNTTTFRVLKDRYTGRATGEVFYLGYDHETGMLNEASKPSEAEDHGFDDVSDPLEETNGMNTDF